MIWRGARRGGGPIRTLAATWGFGVDNIVWWLFNVVMRAEYWERNWFEEGRSGEVEVDRGLRVTYVFYVLKRRHGVAHLASLSSGWQPEDKLIEFCPLREWPMIIYGYNNCSLCFPGAKVNFAMKWWLFEKHAPLWIDRGSEWEGNKHNHKKPFVWMWCVFWSLVLFLVLFLHISFTGTTYYVCWREFCGNLTHDMLASVLNWHQHPHLRS